MQTFNSDGIEGLLERRYPPGRTPYLSTGERNRNSKHANRKYAESRRNWT
ncbi:hypothetical protein P4530_02585 [Bacillus thuringiensis]|nr:hypothetical protein [Bacillus thuringiensis]